MSKAAPKRAKEGFAIFIFIFHTSYLVKNMVI